MRKRNLLIDAAKGLGILLVVLGHSIQQNIPDFDGNIYFRFIYSFHMPFFMFLSGCVSKYGDHRSITKNILRLVVPFLSWYIIAISISGIKIGQMPALGESFITLFKMPDYGLWFLWVLFLCHVCFYIISIIQKNFGLVISIVFFVLIQFTRINVAGIPFLKTYFVYFIAGYLFLHYKNFFISRHNYFMFISVICFLCAVPYWQRTDNNLLLGLLDRFPPVFSRYIPYPSILFRYATAFAGIGTMLTIVYFLIKIQPLKIALTWIGLFTLDIYVSHQLMLAYGVGNSKTMVVLTCFAFALSGSLLLSLVLKKIPYLKMILYGISDRKIKPNTIKIQNPQYPPEELTSTG